jgi:hypothetical protein
MPRYLIELPHTAEECLPALDAVLEFGPDELAKYDWGCKVGEHSGWSSVEAPSAAQARRLVPDLLRRQARVVQLGRFTPEEILSYHQG